MEPLPDWWVIPRDWPGETVFIVGGGTSVLGQNLELLKGRRVIAVNSSYQRVPFADYVVGHDPQWWREHLDKIGELGFQGKIVSPTETRKNCNKRLFVHKRYPPGPSTNPGWLAMKLTTFSAGINLATLKGAGRIVLLGADGRPGANGRTHHYEPHKWWRPNPARWPRHKAELQTFIEPLRKMGVEVINASPGTAWPDLWPVMSLDEALNYIERRAAA